MRRTSMNLEELMGLLRVAAGEPEGIDPAGDLADLSFSAIGYDSLALLETSSRIEREYGIALGDSLVVESGSPRELLAAINKVLSGSQAA